MPRSWCLTITICCGELAEYSLTELAQRFHAPLSTVHGEVRRLTDAGLLRRREVGRSALIQANPDNRLVKPLAELLPLSWGPLQVVAEEFSGLDGAEQVLIFGSWAARYHQRPGKPPHDLDVLAVGRPSREDVYAGPSYLASRNGPVGLFRRTASGGRRGERVRPAVNQPPVVAVPAQKIDHVQSHQDISVCRVDRLLGVGERVIGLDWPQLAQADRGRRSLQHPAEILAVHGRQRLAPVSSFTERVDERTILGEKGSERDSVVGSPCGGELVMEGNDAAVG